MTHRKAGPMQRWLSNLFRGRLGREADEALAQARDAIQQHKDRTQEFRRVSGIHNDSPANSRTPPLGTPT